MQQTFRDAFSPASKLRTREVRRQAEALRRVRRLAAQAELREIRFADDVRSNPARDRFLDPLLPLATVGASLETLIVELPCGVTDGQRREISQRLKDARALFRCGDMLQTGSSDI